MSAVRELFAAARHRADHVALVGPDGGELRYGELGALADRWAAAFVGLGLGPGQRVAVFATPGWELAAAILGAYRARAVVVPVNPRYRESEARHVLEDSGASLVLVPPELAGLVPPTAGVRRFGLGGDGADLESFADRAAASEPLDGLPWPADEDPALIIYTSGTTGRSKGVMLSHRALVRGIGALTRGWQWSGDDVLALALPLFHVHGLGIGLHGAWLHGMTIHLHERFDPAAVVHDVGQRGATVFMGVPTMYTRLLEHLATHPDSASALRRARLFTAGSAALRGEDLLRFEALTGHRILERYGMTETLLTLSNPYSGDRRPGSVGLPVEGFEIAVVDDHDRPVSADEPGELLVRGPGLMTGYWQRPADTEASFVELRGLRWFRTGDVVTRDPDGYVRIVGRKSVDIIKSGGFKIGAREIEDVLGEHPSVAEVAVFGAPDAEWGERIAAAVVPSDPGLDEDALLAELQAFCGERLADYKKPRLLLSLPELPRNAMGKVQKPELLRLLQARRDHT